MYLQNKNKHKRDKRIRFDKCPHIYYVDEKPIKISVTKFVHEKFKAFNANKIATKVEIKNKNNEKSEYYGMNKSEILEKWEKNRVEASQQGTILHDSIEKYYNNEKVENDSIEYKYFLNFQQDYIDLEAYRTEWEIYYEEASLAGSIDMLYKNSDGSYSIYDWKRTKKIEKNTMFEFGEKPLDHFPNTNFWHYSLQLNTYKYILENKYDMVIKDMYLVVLHPNNDNYERIEVPQLQDDIDTLIKLKVT